MLPGRQEEGDQQRRTPTGWRRIDSFLHDFLSLSQWVRFVSRFAHFRKMMDAKKTTLRPRNAGRIYDESIRRERNFESRCWMGLHTSLSLMYSVRSICSCRRDSMCLLRIHKCDRAHNDMKKTQQNLMFKCGNDPGTTVYGLVSGRQCLCYFDLSSENKTLKPSIIDERPDGSPSFFSECRFIFFSSQWAPTAKQHKVDVDIANWPGIKAKKTLSSSPSHSSLCQTGALRTQVISIR